MGIQPMGQGVKPSCSCAALPSAQPTPLHPLFNSLSPLPLPELLGSAKRVNVNFQDTDG